MKNFLIKSVGTLLIGMSLISCGGKNKNQPTPPPVNQNPVGTPVGQNPLYSPNPNLPSSFDNKMFSNSDKLIIKDKVLNQTVYMSNYDPTPGVMRRINYTLVDGQRVKKNPFRQLHLFKRNGLEYPRETDQMTHDVYSELNFDNSGNLTAKVVFNNRNYKGHNLPYIYDKSTGDLFISKYVVISKDADDTGSRPRALLFYPSSLEQKHELTDEISNSLYLTAISPHEEIEDNGILFTGPVKGWEFSYDVHVDLLHETRRLNQPLQINPNQIQNCGYQVAGNPNVNPNINPNLPNQPVNPNLQNPCVGPNGTVPQAINNPQIQNTVNSINGRNMQFRPSQDSEGLLPFQNAHAKGVVRLLPVLFD